MNEFIIRKAERKRMKVRIGLSAPSGAGKTYSGLLLAYGLTGNWEKVGLIDTESKRGEMYSDLGPYNVISLDKPFTPERYIGAIRAFEAAGMDAIVIDSISHEWEGEGGCLQINELLAQAKYGGNTWSAWSETTPRHQRFIEAIIQCQAHVITTVRNKVDMVMVESGGKKAVKKVGTKEITREGFEYELMVNFNIDRDTHMALASKDNTRLFEGKEPFVITPETGKTILEWVQSGVEDKTQVERAELRKKIGELLASVGSNEESYFAKLGRSFYSCSNEELSIVASNIEKRIESRKEEETVTETPAKKFEKKLDDEVAAGTAPKIPLVAATPTRGIES